MSAPLRAVHSRGTTPTGRPFARLVCGHTLVEALPNEASHARCRACFLEAGLRGTHEAL